MRCFLSALGITLDVKFKAKTNTEVRETQTRGSRGVKCCQARFCQNQRLRKQEGTHIFSDLHTRAGCVRHAWTGTPGREKARRRGAYCAHTHTHTHTQLTHHIYHSLTLSLTVTLPQTVPAGCLGKTRWMNKKAAHTQRQSSLNYRP